MSQDFHSIEDLDHKHLLQLIFDFFHRLLMHHGFWFLEVGKRFDRQEQEKILQSVVSTSSAIHLKRLAKVLGFDLEDSLPAPLLRLPREKLLQLKDAIAANWLANDGVWFQAVEFSKNMADAKHCNDQSWAQFSPLEAWSIRKFLNLSNQPGLAGLKRALAFRLYASLNVQSFVDEGEDGFTFRMNDCRVQSARKRKGLTDYPCKSAGIIEYSTFAEAIDPRIKTQCLACPPDNHPEEWYCAWRFSIEK